VGIIKKDALKITIISYLGLIIGYVNKGVLFLIFLTTEQIGLLSLIVAVGLLLAQFSNLGMSYTVWRFFPFFRNKEKRNFGFFQFSLIVTLIGVLIFTFLAILLKEPITSFYVEKSKEFEEYYYWIIPIGVSFAFFLTFDVFLRGLNKNVISAVATELIIRLFVTVCIIFFAFGWINFYHLLILHSASYLIPTLVLGLQLFKNKELHWRLSDIAIPQRFKRIMFSYSIYTYINFIGAILVVSLDTIMVASMIGLDATGVYSTTIFIVSGLLIPYKTLIRISSPLVAKYWKERDFTRMKELYTRISSVSLVIALITFLAFWINRVELFHFLPPAFADGMYIFLILMIGKVSDMYCGLNGTIFISSKKYKFDLIFTGLLLFVVYFLNLLLIPEYGVFGAAVSTSIAYAISNFGRLLFVYFAYKMHPFKLSQLAILGLFFCLILFFEFVPIEFENELISIGVKVVLASCLFLLPIHWFKLDEDVVFYTKSFKNYFKKGPIQPE
jgi:O-antigen/teichoic acid export membrane protein